MTKTLVRKRVSRVLKFASVVVAGCLFIYQISLEIDRYMSHFTTTTVTLKRPSTLEFPQVVLCPEQPFNPPALINLGLDIRISSKEPVEEYKLLENLLELKGLNESLSAAEVWEDASFGLGEIIDSFRFGDVAEKYTTETQNSPYWKRILTPFGNCFALALPPVQNEGNALPNVSVNIKMYPYQSRCPSAREVCSSADMTILDECNSTCAQERIMELGLSYKVLVSRNYPNGYSSSRDLFGPFSAELWQVAKLGERAHPLNVLTIDSSLVEVNPISCSKEKIKGPAFSFGSCFSKRMQQDYSCFPVYNNSNITLGEACKVIALHDAVQNEDKSCNEQKPQQCPYRAWIHEVKSGLKMDRLTIFRLEMALTSPKIRIESEIDLYPFPQLASNIGGSLGLCLGMSLLTVWRWILLPKTALPRSTGYHCRHLLYWSVVALLIFISALHGLASLQEYFNQTPFTAVTPTCGAQTTEDAENDPIYNQVATRLASRAMDCHPGPFSPWEDCVLDCLMNSALHQVGLVAPFVDIKDLPSCPEYHSWEPSNTYIVPSLAMTTATEERLIINCRRSCSHLGPLNSSHMTLPKGLSVDHQFYRIKPYDILCSLGGIVSLYAGLFLSSIIPTIVNLLPDKSKKLRVTRKCLTFLLESFIYISGATLSVFLLYRFFFSHPISSSSVSHFLRIVDQPVLTACHFPPFSTPLDENSSLSMERQWAEAAWPDCISRVAITQEVGTLVSSQESFNVSSTLTPMNRCYSVATSVPYNNFITSLYYWWDDKDTVVFSIHNKRDPPFASTLFSLKSYTAVTLTVTPIHYTRLVQVERHEESYDSCLYRCVHDGYSDEMGCRLPYLNWRPDLPLCDSVTAREHPGWPSSSPLKPPADETNTSCHRRCRHLLREFYLTTTQEQPWIEPGINIIQKRGSYHDIREEDWYGLPQLGNDLGVVAGFTFGTSILSLLQAIIQRLVP